MRIAMFTEVFLPKIDGVVTRIVRTLDALAQLGHEVLVFAPGDPPPYYAGFQISRVRSVSFKPWYPEIKIGLPTSKIAQQLSSFRPDVVHALNPAALAAYGVLAAKRRGIPLLASYHTQLAKYTEELHLNLLTGTAIRWTRFLHNKADINLCTSPQMVEAAKSLGIKRVKLWPKAVDTIGYSPQMFNDAMRYRLTDGHPQMPLAIYIGRISNEKNLIDLLPVVHQMPHIRFAFVGSGPALEKLKHVFSGTNTVFTGYLRGHELAQAYASADIFCFPSTTETLGFAGLESMASAVPVIGANAGGIPDLIDDGITGFLVPPKGLAKTQSYVARIQHLVDNPQQRQKMGRVARIQAEQFSWENATKTLVDYYQLAIENHK